MKGHDYSKLYRCCVTNTNDAVKITQDHKISKKTKHLLLCTELTARNIVCEKCAMSALNVLKNVYRTPNVSM